MKQLVTICCVINPEIIGICSDVLANFDDTKLPDYLAIVHQPRIINVANFDQLISEGLFNLGLTLLKNKKRKREI